MRIVFRLHGELMAGRFGSALVELAASWTIVMLLTGLFLWWPRGRKGLGGVLYPRLGRPGPAFWKNIHAVAGVWVSLFAIVLIFSGLPWAKNWGDYLGAVRQATGQVAGPVDWSNGSDADRAARAALDRRSRAAQDEHAGHAGMGFDPAAAGRADQLDRVVPAAARLALPPPVEITAPAPGSTVWTIQSNTADRPRRTTLEIDGTDGSIVGAVGFAQRHWIDRLVGYGIAIHEGALFGLANQLVGAATLLALVALSLSSLVMWWRRRPQGRLGAPPPEGAIRHSGWLVAAVVALALIVPLFGISLAVVVIVEWLLRRSDGPAAAFLGLRP